MAIIPPNITLQKPFIMVGITTSPSSITADSTGFFFGYVWGIYDTCDSIESGDVILFPADNAVQIRYQNNVFFLIDEKFVVMIEEGGAP